MFSPPQVIFCYSLAAIAFPSPVSSSYYGAPIKVEIFFSFPPLPGGLRIHGEVSHNETWELWQPAVGRGQMGLGRITREEALRLRSVLQQHVLTAGFKDYYCLSTASLFLNDSLSLDSVCLSLDVGLTWITLSPCLIGLQAIQHHTEQTEVKEQSKPLVSCYSCHIPLILASAKFGDFGEFRPCTKCKGNKIKYIQWGVKCTHSDQLSNIK